MIIEPCHLATTLKFFNVKKHVETLSVMFTEQAVLKMIKMAKLQCCSKVGWKRKLRFPMY